MARKLSFALPLALAICAVLGTTLAFADGWSS